MKIIDAAFKLPARGSVNAAAGSHLMAAKERVKMYTGSFMHSMATAAARTATLSGGVAFTGAPAMSDIVKSARGRLTGDIGHFTGV